MPYPMEAIIAKLNDKENEVLQRELRRRDELTRILAIQESAEIVRGWKWGADAILRQIDEPPQTMPVDEIAALTSLPRLADGTIAYPGRMIWELRTDNGGKNWFPVQIAIGEVDCHKHIQILGSDSWTVNPGLRHYATLEAAVADIPNHMVKPTFEVSESGFTAGEWLVKAIDHNSDGEIFFTLFSGPDAEEQARKYARWKNG